jgi:NAD(P)-dependent dehydrogenase (short-subunit alcohol dehydrogenase family)
MNSMRAEIKYLGEGGSLVNISSVAGVFGQWFATSYVAAKHGVVGMTKTAAKDYGTKVGLKNFALWYKLD